MSKGGRYGRVPISVIVVAIATALLVTAAVVYARITWAFASAKAAVAAGDWPRAEKLVRQYLRLHTRDPEARMLLAQVFTSTGRFSEALAELETIDDAAPNALDARLRAAEILLLGEERAADAEKQLRRALVLQPDSADARRLLLYLFRVEDRQADARQMIWDTYEIVEPAARHRVLATWFLIEFAQFKVEEAYPTLRRFVYNEPADIDAQVALAGLLHREANLEAALHKLESLNLPPDHLQGRALLARCCFDLGQPQRGRAILNEWPAQLQDDVRYLHLRGIDYQVHLHQPENAVDCFRQVLAQRPEDWEARHRLALCLRIIGQTAQAQAEEKETERIQQVVSNPRVRVFLDEVVPRLESDPQARYQMGRFYEELGLVREARCWYAEVLRMDPGHALARQGIDRLVTGG